MWGGGERTGLLSLFIDGRGLVQFYTMWVTLPIYSKIRDAPYIN